MSGSPREIPAFTPNQGRTARFTPQGLVEDGFTATTMFQLSDVKKHGLTQARAHGVDSVRFLVKWTHQFESSVTVDKNGFIIDSDGVDFSNDQLWRELEKIHS